MLGMKGQFQVTAGILIGEPMDEYTKVWTYTSKDYDEDQKGENIFNRLKDGAYDYAKNLSNPGIVNWVKVQFIWL